MMILRPFLALDLPYTGGLVAPIELRCPEGSIVHARPPAPINNGHVHVAMTAAEAALHCVRLAVWATHPAVPASKFVSAGGGSSAMANTSWSAVDADGPTVWALLDGTGVGGPGTVDHDGPDTTSTPVGFPSPPTAADVEVMESWYPLLVKERGLRAGVNGAGAFRSGAGAVFVMEPYGTERFLGQLFAIRQWTPLPGVAGGAPGATAEFVIHHADGTDEHISGMAANVPVGAGDSFELRCPTAGGFGDPLERDPVRVADDAAEEWFSAEVARLVYGVVLDADGLADLAVTAELRDAQRAERLAGARAAVRPVHDDDIAGMADGETLPLTPGVVQRGSVAFAEASGAPLAVAPDPVDRRLPGHRGAARRAGPRARAAHLPRSTRRARPPRGSGARG